jgi:DNA topoisomerase-1
MSYQALVIVESPTKAKTIGKILGSSFLVRACGGHVKDLPEYRLGVNIGEDFKPTYVTLKGKRKILKDLKDAVKRVSTVYLAPDPDREGEAISWHLLNELQDNRSHFFRLVLYEITKSAVFCALSSPGSIDMNKVNAQQARRILDRLVGYKLSPLLWKKVRGGLSAGRVQSVALKIICDREREIENFTPQEYWTISAVF